MTLHTLPACVVPDQARRAHTGTSLSTNCDTRVNYNQGCGVRGPPASYGAPFNARRGGWFAMARSPREGIRVWFWPRDDPAVPADVRWAVGDAEVREVFPGPGWGAPVAHFPMGRECDYESHFDEHMMVFDLTFCVRGEVACSQVVVLTGRYRVIGRAWPTPTVDAEGRALIVSRSQNSLRLPALADLAATRSG